MHCLFIVLSCPSRNRLQKNHCCICTFQNNSRALLCASKITNISDVKCMLKKYFYVFHIILKCHERRIFFSSNDPLGFSDISSKFLQRNFIWNCFYFLFYYFFNFFKFLFTYLLIYFILWCQMHETRFSITWRKIKDVLDFKGEILHILQLN